MIQAAQIYPSFAVQRAEYLQRQDDVRIVPSGKQENRVHIK